MHCIEWRLKQLTIRKFSTGDLIFLIFGLFAVTTQASRKRVKMKVSRKSLVGKMQATSHSGASKTNFVSALMIHVFLFWLESSRNFQMFSQNNSIKLKLSQEVKVSVQAHWLWPYMRLLNVHDATGPFDTIWRFAETIEPFEVWW